jgi:23S rRNA pseudouridine2605 synthase
MARESSKGKPFRKPRPAGRPGSRKTEEDKPFGKFHRKPSFDPNTDLGSGEESYSSRKRTNLREEDRKGPYERKPFERKSSDKKPFERKSSDRKPFEKKPFEKKPFGRKPFEKDSSDRKPYDKVSADRKPYDKKPFSYVKSGEKPTSPKPEEDKRHTSDKPFHRKKPVSPGYKKVNDSPSLSKSDGLIRLNKYISNAGICSRREADDLIRAGAVKVNGVVVTEMGYKVKQDDLINYGGETLRKEKLVYVLLNKPKDFITTLEDPGKRKTVYDLIKNACRERIYPVGRLDRNTTGVLLLTNDGELTKKLTHPKHGIKKIYHVTLDKPLAKPDLDSIAKNGVELEDGHILPDQIHYAADGSNKKEVGLEIHSGRNRVVRRLFEHLGYEVIKLDRVVFAGLTKKDLPRGNYRLLSEQEVGFLKMLA